MDKVLKRLYEIIKKKDDFLLLCHQNPDGDAIGATLAFGAYLEKLNKKVEMVSRGPIPKVFNYLDKINQIKSDFLLGDYQVIILLDCGDIKRTGFLDRIVLAQKKKLTIINIDHHPRNDVWKISDINIVDEKVSSTSEILFHYFELLTVTISPSMATALLTGIYGDTGGFQHQNTTPRVLNITSKLLSKGANLKKISKNISLSRSVPMLKLWGLAVERMISYSDEGLVVSLLTRDDIVKTGADESDISGLVNFLNTALETRASMLIYETEDGRIKGSLRTEDSRIDVSALAKYLGGGGHSKAAGFSLKGKLAKNDLGWIVK